MKKCIISFGKWNKRYLNIIIAIAFLLVNNFIFGYIFDGEKDYEIRFIDTGKFSNHFLIHQINNYIFCMFLSGYRFIKEKEEERKTIDVLENQNEIGYSGSFSNAIILIYREQYANDNTNNSKYVIIFTVLLYIILEQTKIIFKKFFLHMDFWMFELHALVILNYFMFKIKNYEHQILAIYENFIPYILKIIIVMLTKIEGNTDKAIYVKYFVGAFCVALIIYVLYAFLLSYTFIKLQKLIDLKFISLNLILFIYGLFGFLFCFILCCIFTFINCENEISSYLFKVKDNNKYYIDNFRVYLNLLTTESDVYKEIISLLLGGIFYVYYKYYTFKIIETLTPYHKTFSYPIYYFFQKFILLCVKGNQIFTDKNSMPKYKLILDISSDFIAIILYLIYLEIIELNFCGFNFNLRSNIIIRGDRETLKFLSDDNINNQKDGENSENDDSSSHSHHSEVYE